MAIIRPCADLRNKYNEISQICHNTHEPVFITKNGTNDLVVLSDETYEKITKKSEEIEDEKIDRLVSEHFDKHYASFKEFQKDFFVKIDNALKDVEKGNYRSLDTFCAEMEEKYGLH